MKYFWRYTYTAILLCCFFIGNASAQQKFKEAKIIEITQTDIARLKGFDASYATVFGIGLDMNVGKVQAIVARQPFLKLERDAFNRNRHYLYDVSADTGKIMLGYLKWYPKDSGLKEYVLYQEITPYLKGLSCSILSAACQDPTSEVYKKFLGKPVDQDIILDIPSIGLKTVRYYYPELSLIIEVNQKQEGTKYNLILFGF